MNSEKEGTYENEKIHSHNLDQVMSPITSRFLSSNINSYQKATNEVDYQNCNYSPFVIQRSNTLKGTASSNKGQAFYTGEKLLNNAKIYTPSPNKIKREKLSDRFIPMNKKVNLLEKFELAKKWEGEKDLLSKEGEVESDATAGNCQNCDTYSDLLENNFFSQDNDEFSSNFSMRNSEGMINSIHKSNSVSLKSKIFSFKTEQRRKSNTICMPTRLFDTTLIENYSRKINNKPYKILEAPGLIDDFYLNLLDWSSKNDIAVGLGKSVVLWCANKTQEVSLMSYSEDNDKYISSLIWSPNGEEIAIGNSNGQVEIWDVTRKTMKSTIEGHTARVGVIAWNSNILSTGSKDYTISNHDVRAGTHPFSKLFGHKQEVCGLKWSFNGSQLASGGNDNKLMLWNLHSTKPLMKANHHTAAVKAIAWSPHQYHILASGGGTADRCIRFWNTSQFSQINYIDTGSQVCNLVFSKTSDEIISTHGYSLNQIINWKLPSMTKIATLTGHALRVLYLGISPDGQNIVTGAGDQTLRFWNVFPPARRNEGNSCLFPSHTDVR